MNFLANSTTFVELWPIHAATNVFVFLCGILRIVDVFNGLAMSWATLMELSRFCELGMPVEKEIV